MKKMQSAVAYRALAVACGLASFGLASAHAETAGFTPNGPAVWCKFDGDTRDYGSANARWVLKNAPQQANTIYLSGKYGKPAIAGQPNAAGDDGSRAGCRMQQCSLEQYTVALRFKRDTERESRNVITYGSGMRWFSIQMAPKGGLELVFNGSEFILPVTGVELRPEDWNWVVCSVDVPSRTCTVYLNGQAAAPMKLPADFKLAEIPAFVTRRAATLDQFDPSWTFTNYSNARTFAGWVDEILIYSRALNPAELVGLAQRRDMLAANLPEAKRPTPGELEPASALAAASGAAADAARLSPADLQERPGTLAISSVGSSFSLAAVMSGSLTWNAHKVKVQVKQGEILRQAKGINPERAILSYQLYVRRENPHQQHMDIVGKSEKVPIELAITHGTKVQFEEVEVEIPLPGLPAAELGQMWVGMFINDAHDKVDAKTGERERSEGICVAESSVRLNGAPVPAPRARTAAK